MEYAPSGWGDNSNKEDSTGGWGADNSKKKIKQDDDGAGGSGSHVYPWNLPATKDRRW